MISYFVQLSSYTCVGGGVNAGVAAVAGEDDFDGISCSKRLTCFGACKNDFFEEYVLFYAVPVLLSILHIQS